VLFFLAAGGALLSLALSIVLGVVQSSAHDCAGLFAVVVSMVLFLLLIGKTVAGRWSAILITSRNTMSLSRLQAVLWTVLLLAAYLNRVFWNIRWGQHDPLAIGVPSDLWMLAGISTTSLVGTPLILSNKAGKTANDKTIQTTAVALNATSNPTDVAAIKSNAVGTVFRNASSLTASFTDVFQGDEVGDAGNVDLSKVQMFFFTENLVISYFVLLVHLAQSGGRDLPDVASGMVALLGISHAGYLANKSVNHSGSTT
jgi:hypothetical protein